MSLIKPLRLRRRGQKTVMNATEGHSGLLGSSLGGDSGNGSRIENAIPKGDLPCPRFSPIPIPDHFSRAHPRLCPYLRCGPTPHYRVDVPTAAIALSTTHHRPPSSILHYHHPPCVCAWRPPPTAHCSLAVPCPLLISFTSWIPTALACLLACLPACHPCHLYPILLYPAILLVAYVGTGHWACVGSLGLGLPRCAVPVAGAEPHFAPRLTRPHGGREGGRKGGPMILPNWHTGRDALRTCQELSELVNPMWPLVEMVQVPTLLP
ncbi:hypothetical protein F4780DRAFT_117868 [Xylariomycetidae sp. FL0641]|nr:hypothetical protein F4780DRAFT_117868 [Xylariomycetidae sp. FL0641]